MCGARHRRNVPAGTKVVARPNRTPEALAALNAKDTSRASRPEERRARRLSHFPHLPLAKCARCETLIARRLSVLLRPETGALGHHRLGRGLISPATSISRRTRSHGWRG